MLDQSEPCFPELELIGAGQSRSEEWVVILEVSLERLEGSRVNKDPGQPRALVNGRGKHERKRVKSQTCQQRKTTTTMAREADTA